MVSKPDEILYPPWLSANYRSQMDAIRALFNRLNQSEDDLQERILEVEEYAVEATDEPNEFGMDERDFLVHFSIFQDAAHSMAAVSMLAPTVESAFKDVCRKIGRPVPFPEDETGGLVADIMTVITEENGVRECLPDDLRPTLEAMFEYRNKMLHCGFEWPRAEVERFDKRRKAWPIEWFVHSSVGGRPWIFYMSRSFISHCLDTAEAIVQGLGDFLGGCRQNSERVVNCR